MLQISHDDFDTLSTQAVNLLKYSFGLATNPPPRYVVPATADPSVTQVGMVSNSSDECPKTKKQTKCLQSRPLHSLQQWYLTRVHCLFIARITERQRPWGITSTSVTPSDFSILRVPFGDHTFVTHPCWTLYCVYKAFDCYSLPFSHELHSAINSITRVVFNSLLKNFSHVWKGKEMHVVNC